MELSTRLESEGAVPIMFKISYRQSLESSGNVSVRNRSIGSMKCPLIFDNGFFFVR
jgi:hypothetical protein